jgi:hypothetical protein
MDAQKRRLWIARLQQWRFFILALLAHIILGVVLWGKVMFDGFNPKKAFVSSALIVGEGLSSAPPPPPPAPSNVTDFSANASQPSGITAPEQLRDIIRTTGTTTGFALPVFLPPTIKPSNTPGTGNLSLSAPEGSGKSGMDRKALAGLQAFSQAGVKRSSGSGGVRGLAAEFTVYVVKLGDSFDRAIRIGENPDKTQELSGPIPNLADFTNERSKDKIRMKLDAKPVKLDSGDFIRNKVPFIFLTGTQNFILSEQEIKNIRDYLLVGGCLWADSSIPGQDTAFDIAFRREIKRVIPDADKPLKPLPPDHPIFKNGYETLRDIPVGLNHIKNPIEAILRDDVELVIYTSNGYTTMWQVALDPAKQFREFDEEVLSDNGLDRFVFDNLRRIFRNLTRETLFESYKLGTNLIAYMLIRYEVKLRSGGAE